jgi:transketolase
MNNFNNIPQRDAFWLRVYDAAKEDKNIVIVSADFGAFAFDKIRADLPGQFVNTGIAEQNTIVLAAGLAMEGKKVFATAIAPFITLRCYEQIRVNLAAMNLPVTLVGVGSGFSYDDSGPTHHALEDLSIMRILPHMKVNTVSDSLMARAMAELSFKMSGPNYVRLDRKTLPQIYQESTDFSGGLQVLRPAGEISIVATGNMVHYGLEIADELKSQGLQIGVIDLHTLPVNEKLFLEALGNARKIVTLEEQTLPGGFGSAVAEVLADNNKSIQLKRIGLDLEKGYCYKYGGRQNIQRLSGVDKETILKTIMALK